MVYVRRDESGRVVAVSMIKDDAHPEAVDSNAAEITAFMGAMGGSELAQSDQSLVRVLEDLLDLLIDKAVIRFTDLPEPAQKKLMERRSMRSSMRGVNLIGEDDQDVV